MSPTEGELLLLAYVHGRIWDSAEMESLVMMFIQKSPAVLIVLRAGVILHLAVTNGTQGEFVIALNGMEDAKEEIIAGFGIQSNATRFLF